MIKKILALTDFSKNADNALHFALEFAKRANSEVMIHHACDYASSTDQGLTQKEQAKAKLQQLVSQFKSDVQNENLLVDIDTNIGSLADNTDQLVNLGKFDLIVMGTRGDSKPGKTMMGSSVMAVLDKVKCPTFIIPETASLHPLRTIAFASDNQLIKDGSALDPLKEIATCYNSEVVFVHVREYGLEMRKEQVIERHKEESVLGNEIRYNFNEVFNSDPVKGLKKYINSYDDINAIALLKRRHQVEGTLFKETNTSAMITHTNIPLLVLQE